jgi:CubicO group peptidase (beta-lactamase class C family)
MMKFLTALLFLFCSASLAAPVAAEQNIPSFHSCSAAEIDRLMEQARVEGLMAGGVVLVGRGDEVLLEKPYGYVSVEAELRPTNLDTIFDLASLTKVVATAPAVMKLAEEGKISLADPVPKWFPEFAGRGRDDLLLLHLLTHTSGLDDTGYAGIDQVARVIEAAAAQPPRGEVGNRFRYADINFILLGELVRRVSGSGLDSYSRQQFFAPLAMTDTLFRPGPDQVIRCAPTLVDDRSLLRGVVQDRMSRQLGGVAGHAGLFGTARDLARFCRMLLNGGTLDGKRVLSGRAVEQMTSPNFSCGGKVARGLGWDMDSPYSSPRGKGFSEMSFGHTGYAGGSVWIDPDSGLFVILLTSRLDYRRVREFNGFRTDISNAALKMAGLAGDSPQKLAAAVLH